MAVMQTTAHGIFRVCGLPAPKIPGAKPGAPFGDMLYGIRPSGTRSRRKELHALIRDFLQTHETKTRQAGLGICADRLPRGRRKRMSSAIQFVFFVRMLATGIIAPVLALMLMAHGATIETVSLLVGAYSVTVVAAELPSGVLADLIGQKRVFLLSTLFGALSFGLILVSKSAPVLLLAMVVNGLSRAFASGTLDALAVNQSRTRDNDALLQITSRFSILESAGLALGSLAGGLMAGVGSAYSLNIAANIALYGFVFFLSPCSPCAKPAPVRRTGNARPCAR